jgi:uncharacterized protein YjiS (DUF1127 family)
LNQEGDRQMMTHLLKKYRRNPMPTAIPACHVPAHAVPAVSLSERLFRAVLVMEKWSERAHQRRALRELPDYALHDLALSQADIEAEASKPFWKA